MSLIRPLKNSTPFDLCAIILASGKGSRFGKPKSEARMNGMLFSEHIIQTINDAGIKRIALANAYQTNSMLETLRQAVTENPATHYLIFPVDHPFVSSQTIQNLIDGIIPNAIIKPVHQNVSGHPIIIPASLDINTQDHGEGLKGIIQLSGLPNKYIHVDDPGILRNINRPGDL